MKHQTESLEHASVRQYCKAVRVPTIGANFLSLAEQAVKENHNGRSSVGSRSFRNGAPGVKAESVF